MNLRSTLGDIVLTSTIHGIPSVFRTKKNFLKCIWAISFLISTTVCAFILTKSLMEYFEYKIVTKTSVKTDFPAIFPMITICNSNPLMTDVAKQFVQEVLTEHPRDSDLDLISFYTLNLSNSHISMVMTRLSVMAKTQNKSLSDDFRKSLGLSLKDMLISCIFGFNSCSADDFEWYYDGQNGNCFKFNYDKKNVKKVAKAGVLNGLRLELFVGQPNSIRNLAFGTGVTILINNQNIIPSTFDGFDISTGIQTNVHLEKLKIQKIYKPFGECTEDLVSRDSYDSDLYRTTFDIYARYRQKDCMNTCAQVQIAHLLNCYSTLLPYYSNSSVQPCLNILDIKKAFVLISQFFFGDSTPDCIDKCPLECDSETYSVTTSFLSYPTKVYADLLLKENNVLNKYGNITPTFDEMRESILKLNINYKELQYTLIEENQKTTNIDLISNIGGTLGLFLGVSFLSAVELIEILFEMAFIFCERNVKNRLFRINNEVMSSKDNPT